MDPNIIPLAGISVGIIVPLAVFFWLYHEAKNKNETIFPGFTIEDTLLNTKILENWLNA